MATGSTPRLARLLALVPYLYDHPGARVSDVAASFGVSPGEVREDLELLFVCGLPGYTPGDLIEVEYDESDDRVWLRNADVIAAPLRLTPDEALSLLVAARTLAAVPGLAERGALDRALAKLQQALAPAGGTPPVQVVMDAEDESLASAEAALTSGRRMHLRYHSQGRDALTERDVDPMRVFSLDGRWYLEAYCRSVEAVRTFRLDRVVSATLLEDAAEPPEGGSRLDLDEGVFRPDPTQQLVEVEVDAAARWVPDYYPCESVVELPDGGLRVALRASDQAWLVRLVLRLGEHARVLSPSTLADEVRSRAASALDAYS